MIGNAETQAKETTAKPQAQPREALVALGQERGAGFGWPERADNMPSCNAPFPSVDAWLTSIKLGKYAAAVKQVR